MRFFKNKQQRQEKQQAMLLSLKRCADQILKTPNPYHGFTNFDKAFCLLEEMLRNARVLFENETDTYLTHEIIFMTNLVQRMRDESPKIYNGQLQAEVFLKEARNKKESYEAKLF